MPKAASETSCLAFGIRASLHKECTFCGRQSSIRPHSAQMIGRSRSAREFESEMPVRTTRGLAHPRSADMLEHPTKQAFREIRARNKTARPYLAEFGFRVKAAHRPPENSAHAKRRLKSAQPRPPTFRKEPKKQKVPQTELRRTKQLIQAHVLRISLEKSYAMVQALRASESRSSF